MVEDVVLKYHIRSKLQFWQFMSHAYLSAITKYFMLLLNLFVKGLFIFERLILTHPCVVSLKNIKLIALQCSITFSLLPRSCNGAAQCIAKQASLNLFPSD